ncbi:hypothetical protein GQ457_01G047770 [Hibiscus cannabinus]
MCNLLIQTSKRNGAVGGRDRRRQRSDPEANEETVETLEHEEQEQVLSLWLHHFAYYPSSDWPNLHASYSRWCTDSRRLLIHH